MFDVVLGPPNLVIPASETIGLHLESKNISTRMYSLSLFPSNRNFIIPLLPILVGHKFPCIRVT